MSRLLSTVLVIGLLGGTAAAFAVTEGLKLQHSPITSTQVPLKVFSPICRCSRRAAPIAFRLRRADRVTVKIENDQGTIVRTLVAGKAAARGRFSVRWDGRDEKRRKAAAPENAAEPCELGCHGRRSTTTSARAACWLTWTSRW